MNFTQKHSSTIIKYLGISFITGAISHGFFSGMRSMILGGLGILFFSVGSLLEQKQQKLSLHALLAIGIGMFTGGLQHFPDSPERSLLITPVGILLSLLCLKYIENIPLTRKDYWYIGGVIIGTVLLSLGYFYLLEHSTLFAPHQHL